MIYLQKDQKIPVIVNGKSKGYTKIEKLTEYVVITEIEIKGRKLIFNRESGESIPKSNLSIQPDYRCKACFSWQVDTQRVRFRRVNRHEYKYVIKYGYTCNGCGYLNAEDRG